MRANHATAAIVLRHRPYGESDKIVSFLTDKFGKLTGIAKGALRSRRRFVNSLEPFSLINLRFQDPPHTNLAFIIAADLVNSYRHLQSSLERIAYASYLVEISEGLLPEREENQAVFDHLKAGLKYLEESQPSLRFLTSFELKLLRLVGYQPVLEECRKCRLDHLRSSGIQWRFSLIDGGLLCETCARVNRDTIPLSTDAIEVMIALQGENPLPAQFSLPVAVVQEIRSAILSFVQYHVDREIKSAPFLSSLASG
ncbi:MAG TPA: DNA repair protein RecO [Candidatus Binatia bacterium]